MKLRQQPPGGGGRGRSPDPLLPPPPRRQCEPRGGDPAGRGRPARSPPAAVTRRGGACKAARPPPSTHTLTHTHPSARGGGNLPQTPRPGVRSPPHRPGPGRRGPQRRGRGPRRGRSCKQPQRPGLASKSPASQAPPRAACVPSPSEGRPSRGPGDCRGVGSPPRRAPAARGAVPAAEKGEVRTYLSLLSTPSWIHLSTSPQSIMGKKEPLK